jgi:hypothetical protein
MRVLPIAFFLLTALEPAAVHADDVGDLAEAIVGTLIEATDVSGDSDD